ncbi:hypothetical protein B484DRAFT_445230 [Ochromonadaceae sp. CCMP2298]|nr:hypothetical protein B484DRAFT_445230 [Ochromonadaceae sp. CCMP2298]
MQMGIPGVRAVGMSTNFCGVGVGVGVGAGAGVDFSGLWSRNAARNVGVMEGLMARGQSRQQAEERSTIPYVQRWEIPGMDAGGAGQGVQTQTQTDTQTETQTETQTQAGVWLVTTMRADGVTPKRSLLYPLGDWVEEYEGPSMLFGETPSTAASAASAPSASAPSTAASAASTASASIASATAASAASASTAPVLSRVDRHTTWAGQAGAVGGLAHVTTSATNRGWEEVRRFLLLEQGGQGGMGEEGYTMVLRRSFQPAASASASVFDFAKEGAGAQIEAETDASVLVSDEFFERQ